MQWVFDQNSIDWSRAVRALSHRSAWRQEAGSPAACVLDTACTNASCSTTAHCVGAGRAVADGVDCSYLCDVAVHPKVQGTGLGGAIVDKLVELSSGHGKIILYANPGTETFYRKRGFLPMKTAMAIFKDRDRALARGLVEDA